MIFVPLAALILVGPAADRLRRLLYAIGDNPIAARLSGARAWQVLVVLYVISALLGRGRRVPDLGPDQRRERHPGRLVVLPSVAAAVIGGTSILGGRGGFGGTIVGALILTVARSLLSAMGFPEAVRQVLFGAIIVIVAAAYTRVTAQG